jgi:hypothetical protein
MPVPRSSTFVKLTPTLRSLCVIVDGLEGLRGGFQNRFKSLCLKIKAALSQETSRLVLGSPAEDPDEHYSSA